MTHTIGLSDSHDSFLKRATHVICFRSENACCTAWLRKDAYRSWTRKPNYGKVSAITSGYGDMTDLSRLQLDPLIRNDFMMFAMARFSNDASGKETCSMPFACTRFQERLHVSTIHRPHSLHYCTHLSRPHLRALDHKIREDTPGENIKLHLPDASSTSASKHRNKNLS